MELDVFTAIKTRRSIRRYRPEPVPEEKLMKVLEAGRLAPSASNRQPVKFVVVRDQRLKERLVTEGATHAFLTQAGAIIAACAADPSRRLHAIDVAIALDHMTLAAWEEGLGTCWVATFDEARVKEILGIPDPVRVIMLLPVGIPDGEGTFRGRKALEEIVSYDHW
ncbi:MAG: nitroreductase family protein [Firmicutes bacterium]|nr:nitroreductase family protein [Bacillota bacterium]